MRFRNIYEELNKVYSYSSLQFNFNDVISSLVLQFGNIVIPDNYLYIDEKDGSLGREDQIHCTILYGIEYTTAYKIRNIINKLNEFEVILRDVSYFEKEEYDVMKIEVDSEYLYKVNSIIRNLVEYTNDYPDYMPHCTIAYLKKGVKEYLKYDKSYFNGLKQIVKEFEFSGKDGSKELIKLSGNI